MSASGPAARFAARRRRHILVGIAGVVPVLVAVVVFAAARQNMQPAAPAANRGPVRPTRGPRRAVRSGFHGGDPQIAQELVVTLETVKSTQATSSASSKPPAVSKPWPEPRQLDLVS